ncbi:hypothetical protein RB195_003424 [Necator americanus]|uniref:Endonuclease/exonuclease/phosphatase domain-containing protein n=1 Tax=Necator americanus TaxID=51031 RepID=A0ABR1DPV3_NECAM
MTICTYNASTLASEAEIKDLMAQAKKIKYDVIKLTETRRRQNLDYAFADVIHDKVRMYVRNTSDAEGPTG